MRSVLIAGLAAFSMLPIGAAAQFLSDPEENWQEEAYVLPPPPEESSLQAFYVSPTSPNEFLVDEASLAVGDDGVVRYVLVIRSPAGAENVSFEGIRCATGERRIYALGRPDGEWAAARRSEWEPLGKNSYNMPRAVLAGQHFCDGPVPPRSRADAVRGLRNGLAHRHP